MARRSDDKDSAEIESLRPYLELAREIRLQAERLVDDDGSDGHALADAIGALPASERSRVALAAFGRLEPDRQWQVVDRAFGDDEIRSYLADERSARIAQATRVAEAHAIAGIARAQRCLATNALPSGHELKLGLFRAEDVQAGASMGTGSQICARLLLLRTTDEPGLLQVLEDLFNPGHGLFVTADYDQAVWERERLAGHESVHVGSLVERGGSRHFEQMIYPGARVDVDVEGTIRTGTLLLGFATFGDEDVFTAPH